MIVNLDSTPLDRVYIWWPLLEWWYKKNTIYPEETLSFSFRFEFVKEVAQAEFEKMLTESQ